MLQNYNKILTKRTVINYTRIKPRSRPPQKKIRIFYAPRFFSGQNRKKSAQITRANTVITIQFVITNECLSALHPQLV